QATGTLSDEQIRLHLTDFASRAYRRPAQAQEIDRLMKLMAARRQSGSAPLAAYGDALKAVLCSPAFLYLNESGDKDESGNTAGSGDQRLSSYAIASRLSYFLWSTMPDQELLDLAAADTLQQ